MSSYKRISLPIDSKGTQIFFMDTGTIPNSADYTTVIIYHGMLFTGDNYERILPFAARNNIRVVVVDRRSTPYTPEEVNDLTSGRKIFLETVGLQVVQFLSAFLDENPEIPRASLDRRSGGLALLGWSLGAAWALAPLAHPEIPRSYIARLEPYLKDCIIQDAPFFALGYQNPAETAYNAWTDPDCKTPEELTNNFANWATQYFNHPDYSNYKSLDGLDYTKGGMINPSYGRMTAEEKQRIYDPTAGFSTDVAFPPGPIQAEALKQTMAALFDGELIKTPWQCIIAHKETEGLSAEHGKKGRPVRFEYIEGNHLVHWDEPEKFLSTVCKDIRS